VEGGWLGVLRLVGGIGLGCSALFGVVVVIVVVGGGLGGEGVGYGGWGGFVAVVVVVVWWWLLLRGRWWIRGVSRLLRVTCGLVVWGCVRDGGEGGDVFGGQGVGGGWL